MPYPFGQCSFLAKAAEEFRVSLVRFVFLNHRMDRETSQQIAVFVLRKGLNYFAYQA